MDHVQKNRARHREAAANAVAEMARSRNLTRFCRQLVPEQLHADFSADFGFRAEGSRFSILKNHGTLPGPDDCFAHIQIDARPLFQKLLGLEVKYPGATAGSLKPYSSRNYYRSHIEELFHHCARQHAPFPPVTGRCTMFFGGTDVLQIVYELHNQSAANVAVQLRWFSEPQAGQQSKTQLRRTGFNYECVQRVSAPYRVAAAVTGAPFQRRGNRLITGWHDATLPAHKTKSWTFTVRFNGAAAPPRGLTQAVRNIAKHYASLPALPREWRHFEPVVLRAAGILLSNRYTERTGACTIHPGKTGTEALWFWDTATNVLGLGLLGDAATGWNSLRLLCDGIQADGNSFVRYCNGQYLPGVQNPILAWGTWNFHQLCPDRRALNRCYPALERYVNWWRTTRDRNGNGLFEWPGNCCTGLDDALQWQDKFPIALRRGERWSQKNWGKSRPDLFASVDVNTQLYLEMRALALMARELGRSRAAQEWEQRARVLGKHITTKLFNPAVGVYQARHVVDGRFNAMISLESFLPIYAGLTPRPLARRLCRAYLLNPRRFYTVLPFPTLDLQHDAFRSGGDLYAPPQRPGSLVQRAYWIGRTWLNYSFWMVGALQQAGLPQAADAAAERILDAVSRNESIYECYDPLTGVGNGHAEFSWGAAAVLALAFRLYRRGPLWQKRRTP